MVLESIDKKLRTIQINLYHEHEERFRKKQLRQSLFKDTKYFGFPNSHFDKALL